MRILLATGRLRLCEFVADDVDLLVELDSDPEVMRYGTFGVPTPREACVRTYLPRCVDIYARQPGLGCFTAEQLRDGEFAGWFQLRDDRIEPDCVELGHRLRRDA